LAISLSVLGQRLGNFAALGVDLKPGADHAAHDAPYISRVDHALAVTREPRRTNLVVVLLGDSSQLAAVPIHRVNVVVVPGPTTHAVRAVPMSPPEDDRGTIGRVRRAEVAHVCVSR